MVDRNERIENYYHNSAWDLAEWLVDAEDEIEMWKGVVRKLSEPDEHGRTEDEGQSDSQRGYEHNPAEQQ